MLKTLKLALAALLIGNAGSALAASHAGSYKLDPSHSQVVFSYSHLGYSTTYGMFSGWEGDVNFDAANPANSSVNVSIPVKSMITGWEARFGHFMSPDFFGAEDGDLVTFTSTSIEPTGESTANITGDLTMNDVTKSVTLAATLNQASPYPFGEKQGTPTIGVSATATILRSDFNVGAFAPAVSDEVELLISIEAAKN